MIEIREGTIQTIQKLLMSRDIVPMPQQHPPDNPRQLLSRLTDIDAPVIWFTLHTKDDLKHLSQLLQAFSDPDGCSIALTLLGEENEITVYDACTAMITERIPVHWEYIASAPTDAIYIFLCPMNGAGRELYRPDLFFHP